MTTVNDVAQYILQSAGKMSLTKLNALCYYSQAWSFAWNDSQLFPEDFVAGCLGPECAGAKFGDCWEVAEITNTNLSNLSPAQRDTIDLVLLNYSGLTSKTISEKVRSEKPWRMARELSEERGRAVVISKLSMSEFYRGMYNTRLSRALGTSMRKG